MKSYWICNTEKKMTCPSVEQDMSVNIVVIGAGLTGLSCAYYLSNRVKDMLVLEADEICYGASGRNTGKVSAQHGLLYNKLMEQYDIMMAKQYYHANMEALRSIEGIIKDHHIDCDFQRCDASLYTRSATMCGQLQEEYQAYLDMGIPCSYEEHQKEPFEMEAVLTMHHQARFDPYRYGLGLADVLKSRGITIYEHSPVKTMHPVQDGYELFVNDHIVHANYVIFASQFPFIDDGHFYFTRMYCEQESAAYMKNTAAHKAQMLLNIEKPLHSYNIDEKRIIATGNAYKSGQTPEVTHTKFLSDLHNIFQEETIEYVWSSQDYITFDHIPMIGKLDKDNKHLLFASGFNKWGNTTSNLAGKLLCAYVLQLHSPYHMLFSPQRLSSLFSIPFVKENMNVVYEFLRSKFKYDDDEYPGRGEGKIMQIDHHHYGVYRDEQDELYIVDATCPHLGCVCSFNMIDKTWDCPCHGSRFSYKGEVIKGPAEYQLHRYGEGLNTVDPHIFNE